uniref:Uncharacterized protein n=1 Tax=Monodon monoceros TaxID=40151 RepID=A0A8C6FCT6_MONMO
MGHAMPPAAVEDVEPACAHVCLSSCLCCEETTLSVFLLPQGPVLGLCPSTSALPSVSKHKEAWPRSNACYSGGDTPPLPASCCRWPCPRRGSEPYPLGAAGGGKSRLGAAGSTPRRSTD